MRKCGIDLPPSLEEMEFNDVADLMRLCDIYNLEAKCEGDVLLLYKKKSLDADEQAEAVRLLSMVSIAEEVPSGLRQACENFISNYESRCKN